MAKETHEFQAETKQLLDLMVHSIYTNHEIFLRELISNASDAIDKLHYQSLTNGDLLEGDMAFEIHLTPDADAHTLTISDNGLGMNKQDLMENLGTIAQSGTKAFLEKLKESQDGQRPHRPVRRRFLFGLHGSRYGDCRHPQSRRKTGIQMGIVRRWHIQPGRM
jgi:molecular chaperone HtpG